MKAADVYLGSDGDVTRAYYERLSALGPIGIVAMNLFRSQKNSARAKVYRGGIRGKGSFRGMAYERKQWAMDQLCQTLRTQAAELGFIYGWKQDHQTVFQNESSWVLYIDIPGHGQVSFHSPNRGQGPDYNGEWDGIRDASVGRILELCDCLLGECAGGVGEANTLFKQDGANQEGQRQAPDEDAHGQSVA